ncbi:MAG: HEAT repeat domain-containing protein [Cyanobacteria bacterium P01_F01_bin.150]
MTVRDYQVPVSTLVTIGRPKQNGRKWFDYIEAYGFTQDHVPELIRLAVEEDWNWDDEGECYASIHAYRVLGQLKAEAAIAPLISLLRNDDSDWYLEDLPIVFGMIGPACMPALTEYLADTEPSSWSRIAAASGLAKIAKASPDHQAECIQLLTQALSRHKQEPSELNGSLVAKLLDLEATDAAEVIEKAYKEGPMDEMVCGSWATVQIELGLATRADFTPEELQPKMSDGMEVLTEMVDLVKTLAEAETASKMSAKGSVQGSDLLQFGKGSLKAGTSKSSKPKSGFGSQQPKEKKKKKKKKR